MCEKARNRTSVTAFLDKFYLRTHNACHNFIELCVPEEAQVGETLYNRMIVDENCDMRYLSRDKNYPNRSNISKNFYNQLHSIYVCVHAY